MNFLMESLFYGFVVRAFGAYHAHAGKYGAECSKILGVRSSSCDDHHDDDYDDGNDRRLLAVFGHMQNVQFEFSGLSSISSHFDLLIMWFECMLALVYDLLILRHCLCMFCGPLDIHLSTALSLSLARSLIIVYFMIRRTINVKVIYSQSRMCLTATDWNTHSCYAIKIRSHPIE